MPKTATPQYPDRKPPSPRRVAARASGLQAEQAARMWLTAQSIKIVAGNFRCRGGEIDLIALDQGTLAIIEVRARRRRDYGGAAGSVTATKQQRIILATRYFLLRHPQYAKLPVRFDVLAFESSQPPQWLRAAFDATGY